MCRGQPTDRFFLCLCQVVPGAPLSHFPAGPFRKWSTWSKGGKISPAAAGASGLSDRMLVQAMKQVRTKHTVKPFACSLCPCSFCSRSGLAEHVRNKHENISRYRCETCGKGYAIRSHYFDHLATHTGVKRNVCPVCQVRFTYKHGLTAHILQFHQPKDAVNI